MPGNSRPSEALPIIPIDTYLSNNGAMFEIAKRFTGVVDGASGNMLIENPSDSNRQSFLVEVVYGTPGRSYSETIFNPTISNTGTELTPVNTHNGTTGNNKINIYFDADYTGGTSTGEEVKPGGIKDTASGQSQNGYAYLQPGNDIVLKLTNNSGGSNDMSIAVRWVEITGKFLRPTSGNL